VIDSAAAMPLAVAEMLILATAGFSVYRRRGASVAESIAFGTLLPWMTLSFLYQVLFIIRLPSAAAIVETSLTIVALGVLFRERSALRRDTKAFLHFAAGRPVPVGFLLILLMVLFAQALMMPAPETEQEMLTRLLAPEPSPSGPASNQRTLAAVCTHPPAGPAHWNPAIVGLRFTGGRSASGMNLPGFFAYLSVVFGTYALARRYAWPATAFAVAVMVASMPRLVLLARSPGLELLPAAATLFALLSLYRTVESPNAADLGGFLIAAAFSISQVWMSRVSAMMLLPLGSVVLFRRHGIAIWLQTIRRQWLLICGALAVILLFSQVWWWVFERAAKPLSTPLETVVYNTDGIQGAGANVIRYLLQSLHIPPVVDTFFRWAFHFEPSRLMETLYFRLVDPLLGSAGAAVDFRLAANLQLPTAWFGPLGGLIVIPAVVYCTRRAPRRLKAVAVMLAGYFFLASLILAWLPQIARQFTLFYVCSGFCTAYFLPPWYFGPRFRGMLIGFSLALLAYGTVSGTPGLIPAALPVLFD
jgi:hypothetical protein